MKFLLIFLLTTTVLLPYSTGQWYGSGGIDNLPLYFGHQSGNSLGNSYVGNGLAGVYLFCNGIGCPGRG
ncbi:hypothetical protein GCK72_011113 [Caenorhabditis remanei]|uniref:Uncharacterized protein n=1 Tax=Caenorhabditis remanei TaxID=31234 RepID=A0A6A5H4Q9_CAERE|nr:hypothetical protein GCK72_011113 [Caenorhabditis remanei]KAF1762850.1 hypothetical protein GCK72_011113 [Caenorhabditis remanei]